MGNKVALHNLGCKVNAYEIEAMQQLLEEAGYEIVPFEPGADIYVINTCTVTNIADRKSRQMLHKAKKMNPEAIVVATGCYVQTGGDKLEKDEAIDLVLGNNRKGNIVDALAEYAENKPGHDSHVIKINQTKEYEDLSIDHTAEHVRAYIKVQDGCNQFCTYCIIPYARGRVRSRNIESVLKEVRALSQKGYKEIVLTGIHLSSYGVDFPEEKKETLLSLIRAVHEIEGIKRIRLGSLEPGIVTREFAEGIAALPKVCPHFHLSLQSGCDETLERMNRRYRSGEYRERCELLREVYGNPALTTDVIVGFPKESEEEFQKSYDFVDSIRFYETHIFKYSRRQGTKAAAMDGQLTEAEKALRSEKMIAMHHRHASDYEKSMLGKILEVLIEEEYKKDGQTWYLGHSREYIRTAVKKSESYGVNDIVKVRAEEFLEEHIMTGKVVE
ncbi:tRNA (N(6)-L-threonylcarbamoyladenosine(37)-C(2))-methylthiotransferase MtaB [Blautia schinkii]|uniref:tRNA (N(6)-L-threonylcarbamoyladenosine(37)-C(2))- methylthiotransferase MtaB n=1 Tax=Blautia schinkii TaxID=180164 RepID=UPI0015702AD1|nr:tRNA (N(6)-L-threonylcarbamoyladenosine(37)-C(2))-methylthiotransferase MtaB [Blautia schinkii]NSG81619.1 tRNA (N(6)-L-threonylcarbamoyladenosine(37)-C(2))-methylthiotransferase MtaB [Blautia schinkii]NSK22219.1 tRNA (N(6)-L-threonylcarbamoyladenosine(37)-C(2))-methylthiotransferase MtaB [Blautia schinkii]NSK25425.1 tRNA (N(6)-L-threonylcarbamoyladenosine(37)-C(2))-methylthiotransferase MtaB [Blautia schinkii]NSK31484.1 tRNA (N(6)-L-threonylcarbamoyladenosine(37)-C(2))-methylthiotransferase 